MKRYFVILLFVLSFSMAAVIAEAQCSICTKTAMQLGNKPAQGLNAGILYLMSIPYIAIGIVGYKWWKVRNEEGKSGEDE